MNIRYTKISTMFPIDLWRETIEDGGPTSTCDGCGTQHFQTQFVHGCRRYNNVDLCVDCYDTPPQIKQDTSIIRLAILDVKIGKTVCAICTAYLIDPQTGYKLVPFRKEHLDVQSSTDSVWTLVKASASWDAISMANGRCHNVCMRCHSAINIAKRCVGIHRLTKLKVSDCINHMAARKVNSLLHMFVLGKDSIIHNK